ncbi:hypothetical protein G647_00675 [Cladophialophora carrionii CBS 160.54]|uniref:RBR-type E3 ubiquitin transferase n=1 Tax=Cladophialophora carrionii CBS 160.54 TaxID=1279043 RepID=V9DNH4_9EURO|nr:uncharacterized protein G647_00675 [Cladophialophora carrionii CBS 160.54]ETI28226.1 hypothetical protein G647_00675 [Cladophialophora carrionii CBS 160.54]
MAGQGTPHLIVRQVVLDLNRPLAEVDQVFYNSEGYVGLRLIQPATGQDNGPARRDLVYTFSTAADAMTALLNHPMITIGESQYRPEHYDGDSAESRTDTERAPQTPYPDADISPPRKRLKKEQPPADKKITCRICFSHLEGLYSTPCRRCKGPECYDCVATRFKTAVKDINRMPVTCCGSVMHHDVARGILSPAEIEEYKQKYDERMNTVDPLYCPVPTCSAFLPPRMFNQNETKVSCHVCNTVVCTKCKLYARDGHTCDVEDPRKFILETFHYKLCPRCGTGVMKMYGCPHVRCQCGAHWCWDCQRPMNACYQKPCRAARNEGNYSDGVGEEFESDEEIPATTAVTAAPVATEPAANIQASHSEVEREVADALHTLRTGQGLGSSGTAHSIDPGNGPGPSTAPVIPSIHESGMNEPGRTLTRSDTQMPPSDLEALITGQSEPLTVSRPETSNDQRDDGGATQEAAATQQLDILPPSLPASAGPVSETTSTVPTAAATEQTQRVENLDDPDEFDWEGRDLDFGDEPLDESTDTWGCRHHFYDFDKNRIPEFWLVGVRPATDPSLEIECMGCFKKTKVWDDDAELEAFRLKFCTTDVAQLEKEALKQKLEKWKTPDADDEGDNAEARLKKLKEGSTGLKSQRAVECRHGCGVVYCQPCKKEARRRIRKERLADT